MIVREIDEHGALVSETRGHPIEQIGPALAHWASNQPVGWKLVLEREAGDPASPVVTYGPDHQPLEA